MDNKIIIEKIDMNKLPIELVIEVYTYLIAKCDICYQTFYTWQMLRVCYSSRYYLNEEYDRNIYRCVKCYLNNKKNTYYIVFVLIALHHFIIF